MGEVAKILGQVELPERDKHNCRVFVDLAENVHIHYREHRLVFTVEEFHAISKVFEDANMVLMLREASGYKEETDYPTEIIGGSQKDPIDVPEPDKSYFNNRMVIEKQAESVMDDIHIHYRDYRLVMKNKETFKRFCECVREAEKNLD